MHLTLFDLDHTLLSGDSDALWCDFLMGKGVLDKQLFALRNADMEARYKAGTVSMREFASFYVGTLAGRTAGMPNMRDCSTPGWQPLREGASWQSAHHRHALAACRT